MQILVSSGYLCECCVAGGSVRYVYCVLFPSLSDVKFKAAAALSPQLDPLTAWSQALTSDTQTRLSLSSGHSHQKQEENIFQYILQFKYRNFICSSFF